MTNAEQQARLDAIASRLEPRLVAAFRRYVASLRPTEIGPLLDRLAAGDVNAAVEWLTSRPAVNAELDAMRGVYFTGLQEAAKAEAPFIARLLRVRVVAPVMSDGLLDALRQWQNGAFAQIRAELREGLRELVTTELARGVGPRQVALALKAGIADGLTAYDVGLVQSFRGLLDAGDYKGALARTLRDRRSDVTLRRLLAKGGRLTPAQVEKMVVGYQRKLVAWRAETFARTQAIQAANDAVTASWQAAIDQGAVPRAEVRRYWVVANDERLCKVCAPVPGLNPDGVGFDAPFVIDTDGNTAHAPPLHPNCRCVQAVRRQRAGRTPLALPGVGVLRLPPLPPR